MNNPFLYVLTIAVTALVAVVATTVYDENVTANEFFHVECQEPMDASSVVGPAYGPYWLVKDPKVAMLAWKFCTDATPLLKWPEGRARGMREIRPNE